MVMPSQLDNLTLHSSIVELVGVGPKRAQTFERGLGIKTLGDLLNHLPNRFQVPGSAVLIRDMPKHEGDLVRIRGTVLKTWTRGFGRRAVVCISLTDENEGGTCTVSWFNQAYLKNTFPVGRQLFLEGKVSLKRGIQLQGPHLVDGEENSELIKAVYPECKGVPSHFIAKLISQTLDSLPQLEDPLPAEILKLVEVPALNQAFTLIHRAESIEQFELGRRRLAWAEILRIELRRTRQRQSTISDIPSIKTSADLKLEQEIWRRVIARIPFTLSKEQDHVLTTLKEELAAPHALARLLHGEVGSGKTAIAFALALIEAAHGRQSAILAPTEILARQHLSTFRRWLQNSQIQVAGFFGDDRAGERRLARRAIASGEAQIAVGTHALFGPEVNFNKLSLIVFDEQHRFGVKQKAKLIAKSENPQVLTMTATPIPRTLAWAQYGALTACELRSRPGSAGDIKTIVSDLAKFKDWAKFIRPQLEDGERCFVVAPHIDGEQGLHYWEQELKSTVWRGLKFEVVNGRMPGAQVQAAVDRFRTRQAQILLGTTVVEVGLDIEDIPLMAVINAQRLGLASLHQLRGRLARGPKAKQGTCYLFAPNESQSRMDILAQHSDGFAIAAADLAERGPGALQGLRQHGRSDFRLFNPSTDQQMVLALNSSEVRTWLASID